jgi:hypothetical protein
MPHFTTALVHNGTGTLARVLITVFAYVVLAASASAATWYVDSSVSASGNGQSWPAAFKTVQEGSSHASPGDTVYISGGGVGATRTYSVVAWTPASGTSGNLITYRIGQEAGYKEGTAIFAGNGSDFWLMAPVAYVVISGDAGDGKMHFALSNQGGGIYSSAFPIHHTRFCYIDFGVLPRDETCVFVGCSWLEIDHTQLTMSARNANIAWHFAQPAGNATYGSSFSFHHNVVNVPSMQDPWDNYTSGPDCIQFSGSGILIYNNRLIHNQGNCNAGGQHQDGIQAMGSSYTLIYNNFIWGSRVGSMYFENHWSGLSDQYFFNNIIAWSGAGMDGNAGSCTRVCVLNNLLVDITGKDPVTPYNFSTFTPGGVWMDCWLANNATYNAPGGSAIDASVRQVANATALSSSAFVKYIATSTNADYHLTAAATSWIGKGTNLTAWVAARPGTEALLKDFDGNSRPATGPWDIGPFQYARAASTNPAILVSPSSLSFGPVPTNVTITNSLIVQNTGSGILAGTATVAAPFQVVSGGSYSLGANQSQVLVVSYTPSGNGSDSRLITFTGGGGYQVSVSGSLLPILPGLSFESYVGAITAPFSTNGGYVSQLSQTGVSDGGRAVYGFRVASASKYIVSANVNAPSDSANSFYVSIDGEPSDPTMIWDIPVTTGFGQQTVSWRGSGTDTNAQYAPKVYDLAPGAHQLIIVGREAGAQLGRITISPYTNVRPDPPPRFRIVALQ